jgi:hypothetical protein
MVMTGFQPPSSHVAEAKLHNRSASEVKGLAKNSAAPAVKREAKEDRRKERWR